MTDATLLVRMINQISAQMAPNPGDQAAAVIAGHIRTNWAPTMRADLIAHLNEGGRGLTPLASMAAQKLRLDEARP